MVAFNRHHGFRLTFPACDAVYNTVRLTRFVRGGYLSAKEQSAVQVRRSCQKKFERSTPLINLHIVRGASHGSLLEQLVG